MFTPDETKKLEARHRVVSAWEKKYGEPAPRVIRAFLHTAAPDEIAQRFGSNPGPHVPPQEIGSGANTANLPWKQTIGDEPEFCGDPKSLAERMLPLYRKVFEKVRGRKPTNAELECVLSVGRSETLWGTAKFPGGLGPGMHNHGAVQCHQGCDDTNSFPSSDTHPLDSGGSARYDQRFRRYETDEDGIASLIKSVGNDPIRMLKENGNLLSAFSLGMFGNRYYEDFNAPPATIRAHQATYDWIRSHATRPPSGTSESFRTAMARAKDPIWAGRVLEHSIGLNKSIEATCRDLGLRRATKFDPPIVTGREIAGAAAGAALGLATGTGPIGAGVGAILGLAAGKALR